MYMPLWVVLLGGSTTMIGSIVAAVFLFKGKKVEVAVTEEGQLRDDQRELINTLKLGFEANQISFQELIAKYAAAVIAQAETQAKLTAIQAEVTRLREDFMLMRADRDKLQADRDALLTKSACTPLLEDQLKDRDKTIRQQTAIIKQQTGQLAELSDKLDTATLLLNAAQCGQERVEGALSVSTEINRTFSAALEKDC